MIFCEAQLNIDGSVPYQLSVDQYEAMSRFGIFTEDDKVELLEGIIVRKVSRSDAHLGASNLINHVLFRLVPEGWIVSIRNPMRTFDSMPEPDAKVVRGDPRDFTHQRITPTRLACWSKFRMRP